MELELGLKITKVVGDINSANLLISKDKRTLFLSRETDTMFILTAHLNGYRRENIKVDINEDGTKLTIRCEKPVQEMIMVGWKVVKKELEMRGTEKSFKIPNGIVLDKIKAKFNDNGSILTISMPKIDKGSISGDGLEELKEDEVLEGDSQSSIVTNEAIEKATTVQKNQESEAEVVKENGNEIIEPTEEVQEKRVCDPKEEKENQELEKESSIEFGDRKNEQEELIKHKESEKPSLVEENKPIDENPQVEKANTEAKNELDENVSEHKEEAKNEMEKENVCEHKDEVKNEMEKENACEHKEEAKNEMEKESVCEHKEEVKNEIEKENVCEHKDEAKNEMEKETVSEHKEYDKPETSGANQDTDQVQENEDGCMNDNESVADNIHGDDSFPRAEENSPREKSKLCVPIVVGSALIVSFFVFVFHFIRSKNQASRRSN